MQALRHPGNDAGAAIPGRESMLRALRDEVRVPIHSSDDIIGSRVRGRELALALGFSPNETTLIVAAISELARNIVSYAGSGEIVIGKPENNRGIIVVAQDAGPGIVNIGQALLDGFSTSGGLGIGLPGIRRLMDDFHLVSEPGHGTTVTVAKWRR